MSEEAFLDTRFAALPRLIRDATNPNATAADVRHFMDELLQADPALFAGALHFFSREGHGFVLVRHTGGSIEDVRGWPRWPLKRLFAARRASLISNPSTSQTALAVPFCVSSERHVVIAPLSIEQCDEAQQTFLDALQSATVPAPAAQYAGERVPRFVWLGNDGELAERIDAITRARGWPVLSAPTLGHVLMMLERDLVDVTLFEASALRSALPSLRAVRHAATIGDAPIVLFTDDDVGAEVQTLVDCVVPKCAGEGELLRVLKGATAIVSRTRTEALRASVHRMESRLRACRDYGELAETCARGALSLGADIVAVMLADEHGDVYAAHEPQDTLLGDIWPTPFMTGESITYTRVGEAFFREAFDDDEYARRLSGLHAQSGTALPIVSGTHIIGTMLAFSTRQPMFQPEFDALTELCERTGRVLLTLREPAVQDAPWHRAVAGDVAVDVFEGAKTKASLIARSDEEQRIAIVLLEPADTRRGATIAERLLLEPKRSLREVVADFKGDSRGIAIALVQSGRLRYACDGVPIPQRVPLSGPVSSVRRAETCESGSLPVDGNSITLLCSSSFAAQIETAQVVRAVQRGLRDNGAMVARIIPRLARNTKQLGFACVTMQSSDVDLQLPPALV
jgi:hypothetical protein